MDNLYNQEEKNEFLNTIEIDGIRNLYHFMFLKSKGAEMLYKKDLYSFSLEQVEDVMRNINPRTLNSTANAKSRINHYITWAINNGRRENNINPIQGTGREWEKRFIDQSLKRHFSKREIGDIVDNLLNAQDQALIQCLFEGIMGQGLSELLSMRYDKVDWVNNKITVYNQKEQKYRIAEVSNRCMRFIENAYKQTTYISEDTETEKELVDFQGNIFKNIHWRSSMYPQVSRANLAKRLSIIKDVYELEEFSAINISESGRIKMAYDILQQEDKNSFDKEDYAKIGDKFNLTKTNVSGYEYYNVAKIKSYVTSKNLKEFYGIEIEGDGQFQ